MKYYETCAVLNEVLFFCVYLGLKGNREVRLAQKMHAARFEISEATPYMHGLS